MNKKTLRERIHKLEGADNTQILALLVDVFEKKEDRESLRVVESLVGVTEKHNERWGYLK